jgi:hypothetical protein
MTFNSTSRMYKILDRAGSIALLMIAFMLLQDHRPLYRAPASDAPPALEHDQDAEKAEAAAKDKILRALSSPEALKLDPKLAALSAGWKPGQKGINPVEIRKVPLILERDEKTGKVTGRFPTPEDTAKITADVLSGDVMRGAPSDLTTYDCGPRKELGPRLAKLPPPAALRKKKGLGSNLWVVTAGLVAFQGASVAVFTQLPGEITGWDNAKPNFLNPKNTFTKGPHFDSDDWYWNYVGHPVSGSEYYLLARNRKLGPLASLGYATGMSTLWEVGPEAIYERASIQDLIITPVAGAVLGELRYQAKQALIDKSTGKANTTLKKILVVVIDPVDALLQ